MGKKTASSKPAFTAELMEKKAAKKYGKLTANLAYLEGKLMMVSAVQCSHLRSDGQFIVVSRRLRSDTVLQLFGFGKRIHFIKNDA